MSRDYERLREQDRRDVEQMAWANRGALHHSTKTPECTDATRCGLCSNAARLAVQHYRPRLEKRFVEQVGQMFNVPTGWSPPCSD